MGIENGLCREQRPFFGKIFTVAQYCVKLIIESVTSKLSYAAAAGEEAAWQD